MQVKQKTRYQCNQCQAEETKWLGQCNQCQSWGSFEAILVSAAQIKQGKQQTLTTAKPITLSAVECSEQPRIDCGCKELNRVLGSGLVVGSVILLGGEPGVGKSTLLLQTMGYLANTHQVLYISGEESLEQIAMRGRRAKINSDKLQVLAATELEHIMQSLTTLRPDVLVIDSIQTLSSMQVPSIAGSVSQVRHCASALVQYAKAHGTAVFLVGHVTKEGTLAGPRVLEHLVDTVLYFESQSNVRYRMVRAVKNRFGAVNELAVFAMVDSGLKAIGNPSALFLNRQENPAPGSVTMATWEGTRPMLVEIQALVDPNNSAQPRRVVIGYDSNRLALLLAVMHRFLNCPMHRHDVFVNVVGGLRIQETAADLAIVMALYTSMRKKTMPADYLVFGEIGLSGEIRPVAQGEARLIEAKKQGFTHAWIPKGNRLHQKPKYGTLQTNLLCHIKDILSCSK